MTTIIAIQGDGFSAVCVDSRISDMDGNGYVSQMFTLKEGNCKVAANGKYLLGAAGDLRAINILHHVFQPPIPPPNLKGKKLDEFITARFIPMLRECFEQQGYAKPEVDEDKKHIAEQNSIILVSIHSTIYVIDGDYSWCSDASGIYAFGSGSGYALGALHSLVGKKKITIPHAKSIAIKAINIAARFDPHTGAPYHWFVQEHDTEGKQPIGRPRKSVAKK
jgi:ATP-dependent protease HslVU (ClpYQ) peptidase subunit